MLHSEARSRLKSIEGALRSFCWQNTSFLVAIYSPETNIKVTKMKAVLNSMYFLPEKDEMWPFFLHRSPIYSEHQIHRVDRRSRPSGAPDSPIHRWGKWGPKQWMSSRWVMFWLDNHDWLSGQYLHFKELEETISATHTAYPFDTWEPHQRKPEIF